MIVKIDANSLLKRIDKMGSETNISAAIGKACALVEGEAKKKAPKDTGALRRSITSKVENTGSETQGVVFTPLEYAPYVEYGTGLFAEKGGRKNVPWYYKDEEGKWHRSSGQHPHPYMRPALNESREEILRLIKEGIIND